MKNRASGQSARMLVQLSRPGGIVRPRFFTATFNFLVVAWLISMFVGSGIYGYFAAPFSGVSAKAHPGPAEVLSDEMVDLDDPVAARREFEADEEYQRVFGWLTDIGNNPDEYRARLVRDFGLDKAEEKMLSTLFRFWKPSLLEVAKLQKQMKEEGRDAVDFLEVRKAVLVALVHMQPVCITLGVECSWGVMPHDKKFLPRPAPKTPAPKKEWAFSVPAVFFLDHLNVKHDDFFQIVFTQYFAIAEHCTF